VRDFTSHQHGHYRLLRVPLEAMVGPSLEPSSVGTNSYYWAHATTQQGLLGILTLGKILKTLPDGDYKTYGFFCGGTPHAYSDFDIFRIVVQRWAAGKNISGFVIGGFAHSNKDQGKCMAGGTEAEQKLCKLHDICHNVQAKRWCVKPKCSQITDIWMVSCAEPETSDDD